MNMREITARVTEIQRKMAAGEDITQEDIANVGEAAAASGRIEDRVLYASAKEYANTPRVEKAEPEEPAKITEADVKAAGEKAKRTSKIEDRVEYAALKHRLESQVVE